jgi:hypothetical protein
MLNHLEQAPNQLGQVAHYVRRGVAFATPLPKALGGTGSAYETNYRILSICCGNIACASPILAIWTNALLAPFSHALSG